MGFFMESLRIDSLISGQTRTHLQTNLVGGPALTPTELDGTFLPRSTWVALGE